MDNFSPTRLLYNANVQRAFDAIAQITSRQSDITLV